MAGELGLAWLGPSGVRASDLHRPAAVQAIDAPGDGEKGGPAPEAPANDVVTVNVVAAPPQLPAPAEPPREPPRPEAVDPAWKAAKVTGAPGDLGEMGPSLALGLDAARRSDMAFCFQSAEDEDAPRPPHRRAGTLQLYLTARENAVDVVDARVESPGNLPPQILECCREVLRGMEVGVFFAEPGKRFRYTLEIEE